jgi:hypothetical protein
LFCLYVYSVSQLLSVFRNKLSLYAIVAITTFSMFFFSPINKKEFEKNMKIERKASKTNIFFVARLCTLHKKQRNTRKCSALKAKTMSTNNWFVSFWKTKVKTQSLIEFLNFWINFLVTEKPYKLKLAPRIHKNSTGNQVQWLSLRFLSISRHSFCPKNNNEEPATTLTYFLCFSPIFTYLV